MPKFFLTTPIYYVNARPHIGHAYTTIVADVLARRHRLLGDDTFFLTGTDEHGQKIERSALAAGMPPQQFTDKVSQSFQDLWARMGITHDKFIRTTSEEHKRGVQKLFQLLLDSGAIYLSSYTGSYCVSDEAFVDLPPGTPCPDCGRPLETVTEENYFFKLSQYQQPLLDLIESNTLLIQPEARRNEVLSFLRSGLKDLSISRTSFKWGIPVPQNEQHVIYVWLDALANYMTALGYGSELPEDLGRFEKFWPADLHIVGKEIIRFHCVYWPAFLLAAGLPTPKQVVAHGWLLFEESKMSKSRGNIVRTETILDAFGPLCPPPTLEILSSAESLSPSESLSSFREAGVPAERSMLGGVVEAGGPASASPSLKHHQDLFAADILRYFLLREIPFGQDGAFSFDALITRYNADLVNGYGNLVSRVLSMITKYFDSRIPPVSLSWIVKDVPIETDASGKPKSSLGYGTKSFVGAFMTNLAAIAVSWDRDGFDWIFLATLNIAHCDTYLTRQAPWKIGSDTSSGQQRAEVLYTAAEAIRIITLLLHPILPYATARVWQQLGLGDITSDSDQRTTDNGQRSTSWGGLKPGTKLGPLSPIFPRADKGLAQIMSDMESPAPLSAITDQNDATSPASSDFPVEPLASESRTTLGAPFIAPLSHTMSGSTPEPKEATASFDPAAGPRTSTLSEPNPGLQVAGSTAETTERPGTPHHSEAQASGIFSGPTDASPQITIDDFAKVELRVAKVIVAERIPKADKLLRLEVDLGYEKRQILSGLAEWYTPEELLGRRIVVITNLAPRKMRGLESHGMLLAASAPEGGKPALATFADTDHLPLGSRLK